MKGKITNTIHGMSPKSGKSLTASTWSSVKQRCLNPNTPVYQYYGARGIRVCEFIQSSPISLVALIGERPSRQITIDRIDNNGHYSCGSCRECLSQQWILNIQWASKQHQSYNRRDNTLVTIDGLTKPAGEWAKSVNIDPSSFYKRLKTGKKGSALLLPRQFKGRFSYQ